MDERRAAVTWAYDKTGLSISVNKSRRPGLSFLYDVPRLQGSTSTTTSAARSCSYSRPSRSAPTTTNTYPSPRPTQPLIEPGLETRKYEFLAFGGAYQPGTNVAVEQRYTYTGREKNPASALMYYRYRQYDPRVGRFGGRDPVGANLSRYGYAGERPQGRTDPLGLFWVPAACEVLNYDFTSAFYATTVHIKIHVPICCTRDPVLTVVRRRCVVDNEASFVSAIASYNAELAAMAEDFLNMSNDYFISMMYMRSQGLPQHPAGVAAAELTAFGLFLNEIGNLRGRHLYSVLPTCSCECDDPWWEEAFDGEAEVCGDEIDDDGVFPPANTGTVPDSPPVTGLVPQL